MCQARYMGDEDLARRDSTDQPVTIQHYNPDWPAQFAIEADAIHAVIGPWITGGIHHIGSTAVPALAAKPIIDIQVGVADLDSSQPCIDLLAVLDYQYAPYRTDVMHWFCKPHSSRRTHHLHLIPTGSPRFIDVLAFRDHLRTHPDAAAEYEALKRDLASRFAHDREAYTNGKHELITRMTQAARRQEPGQQHFKQ
jgi:GrpB-like predicted nucleotidyltransferase (UPF0157 family)